MSDCKEKHDFWTTLFLLMFALWEYWLGKNKKGLGNSTVELLMNGGSLIWRFSIIGIVMVAVLIKNRRK